MRLVPGILALAILAAPARAAAEPPSHTFTSKRTTVTYSNVDRAYAVAIARICDTALAGYEQIFGLQMPQRITVRVSLDPKQGLRLWTDGESAIFLELHSKLQLRPPLISGVFNVYGFCHELGHIAAYRRMRTLVGLPEGVGEGWADYFGSMICGHVWDQLGKSAWPQPHDYYRYGGPVRFERRMKDERAVRASPEATAAYLLYRVDQRYGRRALGKALDAALATRPRGAELVKLFRAKLVEVTGDQSAAALFPDSLLESRATFAGQPPRLDSPDSFRGLQVKVDGAGLLLYYDDDAMDGKQSIGGSGHIIQFPAPEGKWRLDAVWLFGSRYGEPEPPREDFTIFVCDAMMNVLAEIPKPYALFERGDEKWVVMPFDPVQVPRGFHICLSFDPSYTKGIYVGRDQSKAAGHSRVGLPYSRVSEIMAEGDWMIRAHIAPMSQEDLEKVAGEWGKAFAAPR